MIIIIIGKRKTIINNTFVAINSASDKFDVSTQTRATKMTISARILAINIKTSISLNSIFLSLQGDINPAKKQHKKNTTIRVII